MCPLYCTNVLYEFTLHSKKMFRRLLFSWGHNSSLQFKLGVTVREARTYFFPHFTQVYRSFCFLPVCLCDAKCHWEYPNMSAWVAFNCLAFLDFERRTWMKAVLLCRFVLYTHVPFPYNRFPVYVWALSRADPNEQLFVVYRDWDNWCKESNTVYCHLRVLGWGGGGPESEKQIQKPCALQMYHVTGEKWLQMCSLIQPQSCLSELGVYTVQQVKI